MIPNKENKGWHYLAVKKIPILSHGITSKHKGDFYCLNCVRSFRTENKFKFLEKVCKNRDFCEIVMPPEKDNILEPNQYTKLDKQPYITYASTESLIEELGGCANNPENSS